MSGFKSQCIEQMGLGCFTDEQMAELVQLLNKTINDHFERQNSRQGMNLCCLVLLALLHVMLLIIILNYP